jgi:hypothetical protein
LLIGGIVMMSVGEAVLDVGASLIVTGTGSKTCSSHDSQGFTIYSTCDDEDMKKIGLDLAITGAVVLVVGVPFFVMGLKKVPDKPVAAPPASWLISPAAFGKGGFGLRFVAAM